MLLAAFQRHMLSATVRKISRTAPHEWNWLLQALRFHPLYHLRSVEVSIYLGLSLLSLLVSKCTHSPLPLFFKDNSSKFLPSSTLFMRYKHLVFWSAWYLFSVLPCMGRSHCMSMASSWLCSKLCSVLHPQIHCLLKLVCYGLAHKCPKKDYP